MEDKPLSPKWFIRTTALAAAFASTFLAFDAARAENQVDPRETARLIAVRIEGAVQGSGTIISSERGVYKVLTSWHVLESNREGEEVDIITYDGQAHKAISFKKMASDSIDIGFIEFNSHNTYTKARLARFDQGSIGSEIFLSGYPLPQFNRDKSEHITTKGEVIANASLLMPGGYQLLYTNPSWPGMSGGPVLNSKGKLIGVHGQSQDDKAYNIEKALKFGNGINEAIRVRSIFPEQYLDHKISKQFAVDDYIALSRMAAERESYEESRFYADKANLLMPTHYAYTVGAFSLFSMVKASGDLNHLRSALQYTDKSIKLKKTQNFSHLIKCSSHYLLLEKAKAEASCKNFLKYSHEGETGLQKIANHILKSL